MDIIHPWDWLNFALIVWVVISLLAAPLVGRFLAGVWAERRHDVQGTTSTGTLDVAEASQTAPFPRLKARM